MIVDANRFPTAVELTGTGLLALDELRSTDPNLDGQFGATVEWNGVDLIVSEHGDDFGMMRDTLLAIQGRSSTSRSSG